VNLPKSEASKDFVFLTLLTKEARDSILNPKNNHHEKIRVSTMQDKEAKAPLKPQFSTTLVVTTLHKKRHKIHSSKISKRNLGMETYLGFILEIMQITSKQDGATFTASTSPSTPNG
jgi:hypothetical protein